MDNYIVCGKLVVTDNIIIKDTIYDVRNMVSLVKKLEEGGYKNIMELTNNERTVETLELDNIILINFECNDKSELIINGNTVSMNIETLE